MSEVELTTKQHNKIKRAVKALNDAKNEIQSDNPDFEISWYLEDSNNLNLMEGETHDSAGLPMFGRVVFNYELESASGGGW